MQLIETGVRCVEVTLNGWDTHANNHAFVAEQNAILDPALAGLIRELRARDRLKDTLVVYEHIAHNKVVYRGTIWYGF